MLHYSLIECPKLPGNLYIPNQQTVKGAVLLLHGSEGGGLRLHDHEAQFLAAHGFASLALTWCGSPAAPVEGVPSEVINIDLQRTIDAFIWLRKRAELTQSKTALYGVSRGAEQALILASLSARHSSIPKPDAVTVLASTDVYVPGFSWNWQSAGGREPGNPRARAWRWHGRYIGQVGKPIPIERFDGPILLSHGLEDEIWSVERTVRLEQRLLGAGRKVEVQYLPQERHVLSIKGQHAHRECLVDFLERTL